MDSINNNQKEKNRENLNNDEAVEKLKDIVDKAKSCFFCTADGSGPSHGVRPMSVQEIDDDGHLWFLSATDSHKNQEIASDTSVKLFFQGSAHSDFIYITGTASISRDKDKIEKLWEPILKTWFTEGKDDPRISVIEVIPDEGYYWDTKHGNAVAGIKMLIGAALGKTMDDSIEGKIKV
ncbi:MAG: pyridoxamine 5'-phosphate oxidase family protein [Chitinophagaceae bacterium]|nr:pyridoxamine 5'-phosphate oxidase family protein [Chitinophagaceae bacterium]